MKLNQLKQERAKIVHDQRAILDAAQAEKRSLSADETTNYENLEKRFDELSNQITAEVRAQEDMEKRIRDQEERKKLLEQADHGTRPDPNDKRKASEMAEFAIPPRYAEQFRAYHEATGGRYRTQKYNDAFRNAIGAIDALEARALQADLDTQGGYLVVPEQFVARLIQKKDDMVFIRPLATVIAVPDAASLGAPALDNDPADPTWTQEIKTGSEDSTMNFDKRELHPHPLAQRIKVSKKLLRVARMNVDGIVRDRLAYKFGIVEENNFLNGSGQGRPLGVFTASAMGINTDRDVSTGNTATAIKADGLIEAKYHLKAQYRNAPTVRWVFHRDAIKMIRKLKDGDGNYLWKQGLSDRPDTILEIPFAESEYAPNTFTASQYVGIIGDFSYYWIADALNMQVQVLTELYAESN